MNNRAARPGYYILFQVGEFTDAYYAYPYLVARWNAKEYMDMLVQQLGVDDDHYSIAWCPSRNQAQKSAIKNWSNE
jgi:hypothetical protein